MLPKKWELIGKFTEVNWSHKNLVVMQDENKILYFKGGLVYIYVYTTKSYVKQFCQLPHSHFTLKMEIFFFKEPSHRFSSARHQMVSLWILCPKNEVRQGVTFHDRKDDTDFGDIYWIFIIGKWMTVCKLWFENQMVCVRVCTRFILR